MINSTSVISLENDLAIVSGYVYVDNVKEIVDKIEMSIDDKIYSASTDEKGQYAIVLTGDHGAGCVGIFSVVYEDRRYTPEEKLIIMPEIASYEADLYIEEVSAVTQEAAEEVAAENNADDIVFPIQLSPEMILFLALLVLLFFLFYDNRRRINNLKGEIFYFKEDKKEVITPKIIDKREIIVEKKENIDDIRSRIDDILKDKSK